MFYYLSFLGNHLSWSRLLSCQLTQCNGLQPHCSATQQTRGSLSTWTRRMSWNTSRNIFISPKWRICLQVRLLGMSALCVNILITFGRAICVNYRSLKNIVLVSNWAMEILLQICEKLWILGITESRCQPTLASDLSFSSHFLNKTLSGAYTIIFSLNNRVADWKL